MADDAANACAGPFGAFYDFYIERRRLMALIGRVVWGIDSSIIYESIEQVASAPQGSSIADVPCGGGVAFRALEPGQEVRYVAGDLSEAMLRRARRRASARGLGQVEVVTADMTELPFTDGEIDLFLSYSGLHMLAKPEVAIGEIARCLKPGGRVLGTAFYSDCSRRARFLFGLGGKAGHALPPAREDVELWLREADFDQVSIGPEPGFATFSAIKPL